MLAVEPVLSPMAEFVDEPGLGEIERVPTESGDRLDFRALSPEHPGSRWLEALAATPPLRFLRRELARARELAREEGRAVPAPGAPVLVCLPERFAPVGPAYCYNLPARALTPEGRVDAPGFLVLAPLRTPEGTLSREEMERAGFLPAVVAHELFHALMAEVYGFEYLKLKALADPFAVHDSPVVTDPTTALVEGLAEAAEVVLEQRFPGQVYGSPRGELSPGARAYARDLERRRIRSVELGRYIFREDGRVRDGVLDSGDDLVRTEGVVATLLAALLPHLDDQGGFPVLVRALTRHLPRSFPELVLALMEEAPEARVVAERVVLEFTRYALFSSEAAERYRRVYRLRRAYRQGRVELAAVRAEQERWQRWREEQRGRIEAGAPLLANVAAPLWVQPEGAPRFDLNGDPEDLGRGLTALAEGLDGSLPDPRSLAGLVLRRRARQGGRFQGLEDLAPHLPEALLLALRAGAERARLQQEQHLTEVAERLRRRRQGDSFVIETDPRFLPGGPSGASLDPVR